MGFISPFKIDFCMQLKDTAFGCCIRSQGQLTTHWNQTSNHTQLLYLADGLISEKSQMDDSDLLIQLPMLLQFQRYIPMAEADGLINFAHNKMSTSLYQKPHPPRILCDEISEFCNFFIFV